MANKMAKRTRTRKQKKPVKVITYASVAPKQPKIILGRQRVGGSSGMDAPARAYANLLSNPCTAPLVHPLYSGGDTGILVRTESDFFAFAGATDIAGSLVWIPGVLNAGGIALAGSTTEATLTILGDSTTNSPGRTFIQANASAVRAVSACLQAYWPGSENNRQGIIGCGQCPAAWATQGLGGAVSAPALLRSESALVSRMPATHVEVKWRPGSGDMIWSDPNATDQTQGQAKRNAIQFNVAGIPASTGMRIRLVCVYEYLPKFTAGIYNVQGGLPKTTWTFERVLEVLDSAGNWAYSIGGLATHLMGVLSSRNPTGRIEL